MSDVVFWWTFESLFWFKLLLLAHGSIKAIYRCDAVLLTLCSIQVSDDSARFSLRKETFEVLVSPPRIMPSPLPLLHNHGLACS